MKINRTIIYFLAFLLFPRTGQTTPTFPVPLNARAFYFGSVASIPTNWSRDTNFDDRFPQVTSSDDAGTTGGGSVVPMVPDHWDDWAPHTHSVYAGSAGNSVTIRTGTNTFVTITHGHYTVNSSAATIEPDFLSQVTLDSVDIIPPSLTAIFIKPNDAYQDVPVDGVVFIDTNSFSSNFKLTDGNNGTVDLRSKYIKGAETGEDGGDDVGNATTTFTDSTGHAPTISHLAHLSFAGGLPDRTTTGRSGSGASCAPNNAHHSIVLSSTSVTASTEYLIMEPVSSDPAFKTLNAIQNKGASAETPDNIILIYDGTISSIPEGWEYYSFGDYQPKVMNNFTYFTSGSNSKTAVVEEHHHQQSHTHTPVITNSILSLAGSTGFIPTTTVAARAHSHTWTVDPDSTPSNTFLDPLNLTATASDGRYKYRKVILIKRVKTTTWIKGGDILGSLTVLGFLPFTKRKKI